MSTRSDTPEPPPPPPVDAPRLAQICRRYRVRRLAVFGSYARQVDFGPNSDVDVLVDFVPGVAKTFDRHADLCEALEDLFGRRVDLTYFSALEHAPDEARERIERDVKVLYVAE